MSRLRPAALFCLLAMLMPALPVHAFDVHDTLTPDGRPFVRLHIYQPGETTTGWEEDNMTAETSLPRPELEALEKGVLYWHSVLGDRTPGPVPVIDLVPLSDEDDNASATSPLDPETGNTRLADALKSGVPPGDAAIPVALITIDRTAPASEGWYTPDLPVLPKNGMQADLPGTMLHEMFHALGLGADNNFEWTFTGREEGWRKWSAGLHDIYGTKASPGMPIATLTTDERNARPVSPDPGTFYLLNTTDPYSIDFSHNGAYFTGTHVDEVLSGATLAWPDDSETPAVPGLPVEGIEYQPDLGIFPELSHIELQNSLMSHQFYRNWVTLMEAELAVVEDLGFDIDRKRFFGYSVYNSGEAGKLRESVNTHPFFERNGSGDGWLDGVPSTQPWGVGLHVYGDYNRLSQQADLLTRGAWGMGIRIDGKANDITVEKGVTVQADGPGGNGLLVAYGRDHQIVHRGNMQALGEGGIAARFDFGSNELGDYTEYRGSWIRITSLYSGGNVWEPVPPTQQLTDALKGPLAGSFDVSGRLAGRAAAIYISPNALVSHINILSGATLEGDIVSAWNPEASLYGTPLQDVPAGTDLTTHLSFGRQTDPATGKATGQPDPGFALAYRGNIRGPASLRLSIDGGRLVFSGRADVLDVEVNENATLSGNALYTLHTVDNNGTPTGGTFTNRGTLINTSRTGHIAIGGDYIQSASGTLHTGFDGNRGVAPLAVSGSARIDGGSLILEPQAGYYTGTITPDTAVSAVVASPSASGAFGTQAFDLSHFASPTLSLSVVPGNRSVAASRTGDAYSRYAASGDDRALARILDENADRAQGDAQNLFAAMDFSAADGSAIQSGLSTLSPRPYGQAALASLSLERQLSQAVMARSLRASGDTGGERLFAIPLGGHLDAHDGSKGYRANYAGMLAGAERTRGGITAGAHIAAIHQSLRERGGGRMQGEGFWAGLHGTAAPASWNGWQVSGLARLGVFNADMNRSARIGPYARSIESDWTAFSGTAVAHAGYAFTPDARFTLMPFAGADLAFLHQPSVRESRGGAARLETESETWQSLRAVFGLRAETADIASAVHGYRRSGNASLAWNREMLKQAGQLTARFVDMEGDFTSDVRFATRSSISASAGVALRSEKGMRLAFQLASEFAPGHGVSFGGFGRVSWPF